MFLNFEIVRDDNKKKNLIDDIRELQTESIKQEKTVLLSQLKKNKKKIKKQKKNKNIDILPSSEENQSKLIDVDEFLDAEMYEEESISDGIVKEQKLGYEKRKKDSNPFKKEFSEELTLLYDLLDEVNEFSKVLDKQYKAMTGSKVRGTSKFLNDMTLNLLSSKTNKLQIIKEITNLKKTIADLKIKSDAKNKGNESAANSATNIASQYLRQVMQMGRNQVIGKLKDEASFSASDERNDALDAFNRQRTSYNEADMDEIDSIISQRLDSEENPFRSSDGNKYIKYENMDITIVVKRCIDTGEWEFVAIDSDEQVVYDYPVPKKDSVGTMKFKDGLASDSMGRMYKVIEYYSFDD